MQKITTSGLDIAKTTFHAMHRNQAGKNIKKKKLTREKVLAYFANMAPHLIGIESCSAAHYWARELEKQGHTVRLIPPQFVKPYVLGNKNDFNDASAIAEAVTRPEMRFVQIKTTGQHDTQSLMRIRKRAEKDRTAHGNMVRGLLAEYGISISKGIHKLYDELPQIIEDAENGLSIKARASFQLEYEHLCHLRDRLEVMTATVHEQARDNEDVKLLMSIPGYGPMVASTYHHHVGDGSGFSRGRDVSSSLGIVPGQHSSGGKDTLLGISKRGDKQLRTLLIHGARAVLRTIGDKEDKLSVWLKGLIERRGFNKAAVAYANKMARMGWAVLRTRTPYQADYKPAACQAS